MAPLRGVFCGCLQGYTDGPTDGPPGKNSASRLHRWSNGWTTRKGFHLQTAPVVQRMDHRERIPPPGCTGGPTNGPPGKNSASRLHRRSNGWTTGKGIPLQTAPVVQRMDHRERFPPKSCTGGPKDGPSGKVSVQKQHRWSNGWTTRKGFPLQTAPVVQWMDHRHNATCHEAIKTKEAQKND